eukprot:7428943-Lingulodinium_polyedra.AAC.1
MGFATHPFANLVRVSLSFLRSPGGCRRRPVGVFRGPPPLVWHAYVRRGVARVSMFGLSSNVIPRSACIDSAIE